MRWLVVLLALLLASTAGAQAIPTSLAECNALCNQYFPGGPIVPPVTPPVVPPTTKVCTMPITFERDSDQGNGAAAILFRTLQAGSITAVSVNGEAARLGKPYKNAPVFLMSKSGDQYPRPLKFIVQTSDGQTCTAVSGSSETPSGPSNPTIGYKNQKSYGYFNHANGRQAWRIPENGPWFGQQAKVVFSSGKEFTVYDTSKNCRDQEKSCSRNSKAQMYGFVWKSGLGENGEGDSNTGTSHHGVYIHAPHGDTSKSLTIYYNGR